MIQPTGPLVPPIDPTPLPAPAWLFQVLLIVTFLVHLVFMNLMLGGALLAAYARLRTRTGEVREHWMVLADRLMDHLPWFIAFTVTTGIAPLLFIQVLYGPLFYTSTISVGWVWMALLLVIIAAYYAAYAYKFGGMRERTGSSAPWWAWTAAVLFVAAAAIQVLVNTLQITPDRWIAVYQGLSSGFSDLSCWPQWPSPVCMSPCWPSATSRPVPSGGNGWPGWASAWLSGPPWSSWPWVSGSSSPCPGRRCGA